MVLRVWREEAYFTASTLLVVYCLHGPQEAGAVCHRTGMSKRQALCHLVLGLCDDNQSLKVAHPFVCSTCLSVHQSVQQPVSALCLFLVSFASTGSLTVSCCFPELWSVKCIACSFLVCSSQGNVEFKVKTAERCQNVWTQLPWLVRIKNEHERPT